MIQISEDEYLRLTRATEWIDAASSKPETSAFVQLWRTYGKSLPGLKGVTGFLDYGFWAGIGWYSRLFNCWCDDVKFYRELPATLPPGES